VRNEPFIYIREVRAVGPLRRRWRCSRNMRFDRRSCRSRLTRLCSGSALGWSVDAGMYFLKRDESGPW